MNEKFANDNPKIVQSLEKLAGKITTKEMQEMNYKVSVKHQKASVVAHKCLVEHGLLK